MTTQDLAELLRRRSIVHPSAVDDPEGYDNGIILGRIALAAQELSADKFVPGMWRCPQCQFTQQNNILAPNGIFANTKPELRPCPNDGRDMEPVTWKQLDDENQRFGLRLMDEIDKLKSDVKPLLTALVAFLTACDDLNQSFCTDPLRAALADYTDKHP